MAAIDFAFPIFHVAQPPPYDRHERGPRDQVERAKESALVEFSRTGFIVPLLHTSAIGRASGA